LLTSENNIDFDKIVLIYEVITLWPIVKSSTKLLTILHIRKNFDELKDNIGFDPQSHEIITANMEKIKCNYPKSILFMFPCIKLSAL
jgi:hypothetical protein